MEPGDFNHLNPAPAGVWNPLPFFDTVKHDGELNNIQSIANFYSDAGYGSLPAVSWVVRRMERVKQNWVCGRMN